MAKDICGNEQIDRIDKIKEGFKINWMKMKDASTGKVMWECHGYDLSKNNNENLPKEILECSEIVREINFSSKEVIENLELIQNFFLNGELIESSRFLFGFVIPNSTNNWEQIIESKGEMIPYYILSGNLNVETTFLSNGNIIANNMITIYYI
jgi:retinal rod rhodopsin-sensitive cGMP 3',5'-cyclic phosphodiesterase subunit delta